ncbi:methyltransferase domain-containing protein [Agromyces cerinus subsp. nitratus]|uniref:methyltransferase domain-containing protein n=1 Tax=Agromyces cerinus TaxID=33878 RepID=UPI001EF8FCC2
MDECCDPRVPCGFDDVFGARFAAKLARRFRRHGLTDSERRVTDLISALGVEGRSVLEIGGGIGAMQLELLARGAASAVNLELSDAYEGEAAELIRQAGVESAATRIVGIDLAVPGHDIEPADFVILHRVVCCYPDFTHLLGAAAAHARRAIVFTYPSPSWVTRALVRLENAWMAMRGSRYRGFIHSPEAMIDVLRRSGMVVSDDDRVGNWNVAVAVRAPIGSAATTSTA